MLLASLENIKHMESFHDTRDFQFGTQPLDRNVITEYVNENINIPVLDTTRHVNADGVSFVPSNNQRFGNSFLGNIDMTNELGDLKTLDNSDIIAPEAEIIPFRPEPVDFLFELALAQLASSEASSSSSSSTSKTSSSAPSLASILSSLPSPTAEEVKRRPNCRFLCVYYREIPKENSSSPFERIWGKFLHPSGGTIPKHRPTFPLASVRDLPSTHSQPELIPPLSTQPELIPPLSTQPELISSENVQPDLILSADSQTDLESSVKSKPDFIPSVNTQQEIFLSEKSSRETSTNLQFKQHRPKFSQKLKTSDSTHLVPVV